MCVRDAGGFFYFLVGSITFPDPYIAGNAVVEENRFLRYDTDLFAHRLQGIFLDVDTIDQQLAFAHIMKAGDQVGQGGLAGTR